MPTLIVENVPADVYERLQKRAAAERRSLPEETLHLLTQLLREDTHPALRLPDLIPVEEVRGADSFAGEARATARANDIKDALATLPRAQREVLVLRHFAGLSPTEIATRTGRSEGSIHGLHHRGRRALWAELINRDAAPATRQLACRN